MSSENKTIKDYPVKGFPLKFEWQNNEWIKLFDEQARLIQDDIARAEADGRNIIYLSCPISNRGGGFFGTNVEIAKFTQHRLMNEFGSEFWILNPAQYQMESKEGTGLIHRHARALGIDMEVIENLPNPRGGDYMRMWTKVLVEDGRDNIGGKFSGYYFLGPKDTQAYFSHDNLISGTSKIEGYFARKFTTDIEFRSHFDPTAEDFTAKRKAFIKFYGLRAGANFSKGCHDEWNILVELNKLRLEEFGIGEQVSCFFDGVQSTPSAAQIPIYRGYAIT